MMMPVSASMDRCALNPSWRRDTVLCACRACASTVLMTQSRATRCAMRNAPVGAIRALDRFDVLARDQGQQRQRLGRLGPMLGLGQAAEQPVRVTDQRLDELLAGLLLIPGDPRLPGVP